ncbi:hypothetical protein [Micromonospora zhanjiangensis]|uniref:DUF5709 domain-containing protein n=1 Tax=Micromonospora zhanjiangensis TaxID=1522057 RepID=A0ABV8KUL3_9ACTN
MSQPGEDFQPGDHLTPDERDPEAPADDAQEQATLADPNSDGDADPHRGLEVDDWDAMEQARVVGLEDEYDR